MDSENVPSAPSTPVTPGTPGVPLFGGFKSERSGNTRKSLLKSGKCFSVEAWPLEEGSLPSVSCALQPPPVSLARKVGAEFIGTLILIFSGTATAIVNQKTQGSETLLGLAASTGLAVMIVILSTGHISGAHLNPSVTIAFAALKHFPWKHVPVYIGAQATASICAAFALKGIFHPIMGGGVTVPSGSYGQAFALEFIITFNLMFVVTAVATDTRAVGELAGIAVGATVMLNILVARNSAKIHKSNSKGHWTTIVNNYLKNGFLVLKTSFFCVMVQQHHRSFNESSENFGASNSRKQFQSNLGLPYCTHPRRSGWGRYLLYS